MSEVRRRLGPLLGMWDTVATVNGKVTMRGWASFAWADDGEFLVQRADADPPGDEALREWIENSPFPTTSLIGYDDGSKTFTMLYSDARGVLRAYGMDVDGGMWRIWRAAEGFNQRFTGTIAADGKRIDAYWEMSQDGLTWSKDFDLTYTRG
ncbi:hypothetical protein ACQP2P_06740 [Dactylosporangium sp. CA-139114]|uniref:hypothetical protein n=1 Tax=Dactylosporangium sp. CA-139114 TaxID=3239931 RepID=UPI003D965E85